MGGGLLISPWVDLMDFSSPSWKENARFDFLPVDLAYLFAGMYAKDMSLADVSASHIPLAGLPPLHIQVGSCECLRDQICTFAQKAEDAGVAVDLNIQAGMVHVFPIFQPISKPDTPPARVFQDMATFIDKVCPPGSAFESDV